MNANLKTRPFVPIRLKLLAATIVAALSAVLIAIAGLYCMHLLNLRLKEVVDSAAEKVKLTHLLRQDLGTVLRAERNMYLVVDKTEFARLATTVDVGLDSIDRQVQDLRVLLRKQDQQTLDQFVNKLEQWRANNKFVRRSSGLDSQRKARELSLGEGEVALSQFDSIVNQMMDAINLDLPDKLPRETDSQRTGDQPPIDEKPTEERPTVDPHVGDPRLENLAPKREPPPSANPKQNATSAAAKPDRGPASARQPGPSNPQAQQPNVESPESMPLGEQDPSQKQPDSANAKSPPQKRIQADKLKLLTRLQSDVWKLQRAEKNLILVATNTIVEKPETILAPHQKQINSDLVALKSVLSSSEMTALENAEIHLEKYFLTINEILIVVQEKGNTMNFYFKKLIGTPLANACESLAEQMATHSESELGDYERESSSLYVTFRNALLTLSIISVVACMTISLLVGGVVANNIRKLSGYARQIHRAKDLSRPVPKVSNDEIGDLATAFDDMRISLLNQNNQLASLNETLEQKNDEMEQFVYSVSHDLKSPLVSCKGLVGLINEDIADGDFAEVERSAKRLSGVTDHMSQTIDDLLTFSRLGRDHLQSELIDMQSLVDEIAEHWKNRSEANRVHFKIAKSLPPTAGDPIAIRRVFDNLIGNALKYAGDVPDAKVEIGFLEANGRLRFFVRDNGPGIAPQYHEKIFGLFQRLSTNKSGTGIGLASVAKIMRQHHGKVWVDSQPDQGATFWIEFPNHPTTPNHPIASIRST